MGNKVLPESIQGILNLDLIRKMRFRDDRKEMYLNTNALSNDEIIELRRMASERFAQRISYEKWERKFGIIQF
ncbi:MAG: hypothetical protein K0R09_2110 [Clostridiales bacterium]|jgi:DNA-binding transcriptional regulator YiaG|nr:hypothetical protein [Clostridiales bacterium]